MKVYTKHLFLCLFIVVYLAFTLLTYKQWPISNSEEFRYLRGKETLEHFLGGQFTEKLIQPTPNYFLYNFYPAILVYLNPKFYYEWFHLFNLLFSALGFIAIYFLALELTRKRKWAIFSLLSLILFPGFFGQLAINTIDMPYMVFYLWSLFFIIKYSKKGSDHWSTVFLGILFGITQSLRQLGFTLYILIVFFDLISEGGFSRFKNKQLFLEKLLRYFYIFIIANFIMVITWPNFAINVFKNYIWYLFVGSNFYLWSFGLLFFGEFLQNSQRPWFYLPFLQLITYPIYIIALFIPSILFFKKSRIYTFLLGVVLLNYLLYFVLKPVLYDGIRHFLFLIPIITLLAIQNLNLILQNLKNFKYKTMVIIIVGINLITLGAYTIKEFPYHYFYFNKIAFVFGNPYELFESDYSNTKYREAAEWLRNEYVPTMPKEQISKRLLLLKVYACDNAYALDYFSHKKFLSVIHKEDADLIVCDFRNLKQSGYKGEIIKRFYSNGHPILYVMKLE